ncbi:UNVERIFIED_CONTAM: hypothetical protein Cloal_3636 [Acetivibrio alkalicellulosi]
MKKKFFQKLYNYDEQTKTYLIEVSLDDYNDVYDDWDPSPFKKRDIEDEFNDFVVDSSEDIPLNFNITLVLYLPEDKRDSKKESTLVLAFRNFYEYAMARHKRFSMDLDKKTLFYLMFSILLLSVGYFFSWDEEKLLFSVLHEGIFIGGWVFLWEFFTTIFITKREAHKKYKLFKRLFHSEITFIYK